MFVYTYKYVDIEGSAAMLTAKGTVGIAPEVNLRNPFHTGDEASMCGDPS